VEFDLAQDRPVPDAEIAYFIRGFRILERTHEFDGFTVCFAWGSLTRLPVLGENVVALIYGDEHCRIPPYAGRVRAVLKCHGLFPTFVPRTRPLRLAQVELAEFLRNLALWLPTGWRWLLSRRIRARCHLLPVGYVLPSNLPVVEFGRRRYLTSFMGSVVNEPRRSVMRTLVGTPKTFSRRRLLPALREIEARYGAGRVRVSTSPDYQTSIRPQETAGPRTYAEVMAHTQICVAPRGTTHETGRLYEGLRAGCVVIADQLPRHPFLRGSPILQIEDWRDLPVLLEDLLRDPDALQARHEESLRFWIDNFSEESLARRYAAALDLAERSVQVAPCRQDSANPGRPVAEVHP
jgi:hypothetical protein